MPEPPARQGGSEQIAAAAAPARAPDAPHVATATAMRTAAQSGGSVVVLVRDGGWSDLPGVCCWRSSIPAAFAAAGGRLEEITWTAPQIWRPSEANRAPKYGRRIIAAGQRRVRRVVRRLTTTGAPGSGTPQLDHAELIITETVDTALALAASGLPRHRIWALALPAEQVLAGGRSAEARKISHAGTKIGGFITDSDDARAAIERATAGRSRAKAVIFPPLAVDRACPECADVESDTPGDDPTVAQLALWRRIIRAQGRGAESLAYSYPAARLLGPAGVGLPLDLPEPAANAGDPGDPRWGAAPRAEPVPLWPPTGWTADDQVRGAREVLGLATEEGLATARVYQRRRALVAGFDLKFIHELAEHLDRRVDLDITVDEWRGLSRHGRHTAVWVREAQSIVAEWARPSAIWLARRKRPGQFLVVRLHRYEITTQYPRDIDIDNVDAVVYISPLMGRRIRDELGWPVEKLIYIPNFLDIDWFERPKPAESRFMLGLIGVVPRIKRMDLALDLLAAVRRVDPRYRLVVRSAMPWANPYIWPRSEERDYFGWCFGRIDRDPLLRGSVIFDPPGRDMARWFTGVGHVLSTSDIEGGHTVVAEGMASGAVPVVRPWPGASEVYGSEWIHPSIDAAAAHILGNANVDTWTERAAVARAEVRSTHNPRAVIAAWADLLHGNLDAAKRHFPQLDDAARE